MRILAIDPGLRISGYVLLAGDRVEASGVLPNEEILDEVIPDLCAPGTVLAVEEVGGQGRFVGLDELRTARWSGRFEERWNARAKHYLDADPVARFVLRCDVKLALLGLARGNDAQVRRALIDLWGGEEAALGPKGQKVKKGEAKIRGPLYGISSHAWSALAVAVTVRDQLAREAPGAPPVPAGPARPATPPARPATGEAPDAPTPAVAPIAPPDPLGTQIQAARPGTEP